MRYNKSLTFSLLIAAIVMTGCNRAQKMNQQAYDHSELSNYGEALVLYEELLEKKPDKPILLNDYGWVLFMSDSLQQAEEIFVEAQQKGKNSGKLLKRNIEKNLMITRSFMKIKSHLENQEPEKAKEILNQLDKSWKVREMRLKYYALTHEQLGNPGKAREYWQQIIDKFAHNDFKTQYHQLAEQKLQAQ